MVGLLAAMGLLGAACVEQEGGDGTAQAEDATDWEPEFVDGELQPLPDGFPEHEITLVNVDVAGSRDGLYARTLDKVLSDISPVDIAISDEPAVQGGTVYALADTETRPDGMEGYYPVITDIVGTATDFHIEPITNDIDSTLQDINFLIATEVHPFVVAQRADAPWGASFDEFVKYAEQNPGELRYISNGVGSGHDIAMEWLLNELGIEVKKVPAEDRAAATAAVVAGEGDITMVAAEDVVMADERVTPILFTSQEVPEPWSDDPGVASAKDFGEYGLADDAPWATVLGFMLPAQVPDLHDRWMTALFEAAFETEQYDRLRMTVPGISLELRSTAEANEIAKASYDYSEPVVRDVGLHWEDQ